MANHETLVPVSICTLIRTQHVAMNHYAYNGVTLADSHTDLEILVATWLSITETMSLLEI